MGGDLPILMRQVEQQPILVQQRGETESEIWEHIRSMS